MLQSNPIVVASAMFVFQALFQFKGAASSRVYKYLVMAAPIKLRSEFGQCASANCASANNLWFNSARGQNR